MFCRRLMVPRCVAAVINRYILKWVAIDDRRCICLTWGLLLTLWKCFYPSGTLPSISYYETKFCHRLPDYFRFLFAAMSLHLGAPSYMLKE